MSNFGVTILIKAPNQMVEDQSVQCERSWTVKELKQHLADVYPSKPHPDGQKLIYSGKLLADAAVLSDILRTHDGHENNTIHLVCSYKESQKIPTKPVAYVPPEKVPDVEEPVAPTWNPPPPAGRGDGPIPVDEEELRRRYSLQMLANMNPMVYPNHYNQESMQRQMMWLQQAYLQYMSQYMQMADRQYYPQVGTEPDQPLEPQPAPPNEPQENGGDDEAEEEGHANRDWLEWLFYIKRLLVLFSVVYLYSSPMRFILVVTMTLILFHINLDRWRRRNNNGNEVQEAAAEPREEGQPDVPTLQERPHWLSIAWTFLSSFFLSLIPDQRDIQ